MQKFLELFSKYSSLFVAIAAAYYLLMGIFGIDPILRFVPSLYSVMKIVYIVVGLVGVLKVIELAKPDLFNKISDGKKK